MSRTTVLQCSPSSPSTSRGSRSHARAPSSASWPFSGDRLAAGPAEALASRTAIVMPVYNEQTARTFAAVEAIREIRRRDRTGSAFDYFIVSDTPPTPTPGSRRNAPSWTCGVGSDRTRGSTIATGRRTTIARRATSLTSYAAGAGLRPCARPRCGQPDDRRMHRAPRSPWKPIRMRASSRRCPHHQSQHVLCPAPAIRRRSLRPRHRHGPRPGWVATATTGDTTPSSARRRCSPAGLPDLKGKPPIGGHILSHDFVEAALIRRAGWTVYMLPDLGGSYEESPPSLIDLAARDRRWCRATCSIPV